MIKNLLLVALRNFKRDKAYSLLNIIGLTIGITFGLFLIFYVKDELSYDRYNEHGDRIIRISSYVSEPDKKTMKWAGTPMPLAPTLAKDFPEVREAVRFLNGGRGMWRNGDVRLFEDKAFLADSNVFRVFTYPFIEGDPNTALVAPDAIVLTESVAIKFFGSSRGVVGKSLQDAQGGVRKVTAVLKDIPQNSHLRFNVLRPMSSLTKEQAAVWGNFSAYTYILLKPHTDPAVFEKKMLPLYDQHLASEFARFNIKIRFGQIALTDIHLHSDLTNEPEDLGSMSYIYIFSAVALFMLIIACINYMNLTTARSARRAKEIGIRKVTGSSRSMLVIQFLLESVLTAILALLLSIGLIVLLLPAFNSLSGKLIAFNDILNIGTLPVLLVIILFVGAAGGSYPAFYLSKFNPVEVLKGSLSKGSSNVTLRRVLVVVQFSISMIMLICTSVVYGQLRYLRNVDMGFDKRQVIVMRSNADRGQRAKLVAFRNELKKDPRILSVTTADATPGDAGVSFNLFSVQSKNGYADQGIDCYSIDEEYFRTMGMQINTGRDFSGPADTLRSIIVNENMVKYFGWNDPIGKKVKFPGDTSAFYFEVVGVVKDFNQKSLYNPIAPLILFYRPASSTIAVKLEGKDLAQTTAGIERLWKQFFPDLPFAFSYLDQQMDSQYAADEKRGKIFTSFSVLTILITCLGLLGLIAFTTQQRQKEIGIRKIMGAGVSQIVPLITVQFVVLVGISCLVAFPVAYLFMDKWLRSFPYNTGINVPPFLLSAIAVLSITLLTVIFHTMKAALANPAASLRSE